MEKQNLSDHVEVEPKSQQVEVSSVEAQKDSLKHDVTKDNLVYDNEDEEPELHLRTYIALISITLLNYVQVIALQSPPAVLNYIGRSLNNPATQTWIPNALSLVQVVLGPIIASASDTFQARKHLLFSSAVVSFIGSAIAPGSTNIYRLIAAQAVIGVGYASVPLAYAVPSEMLPRKWIPLAQAFINMAQALASISGPLIIGALTKADPLNGWRKFYWIQMALWGVTAIGIFFGYNPPKRYTRFDHLTVWQKIGILDLVGCALITAGLTLVLTGLNLGGGLYSWTDARTLSTLVIGLVLCICFGVYEWKGTTTGILHHNLFRNGKSKNRTFTICCLLFGIEAILMFAFTIFYPVLTEALFEQDPFLLVSRSMPYWVATLFTTGIWGYFSSKFKTIKSPLFAGFIIYTAGTVGLATLQPGQSFNTLAFSAVSGIGFAAPVVLLISGIHLAIPHELIASATAVATSTRALSATVFTAIYTAAVNSRLPTYLPNYIAKAALGAGLPPSSLPSFIQALVGGDTAALSTIPGVSPMIIGAGVAGMKQAFADGVRVVFIIASAFAAAGCIAVLFIGDLKEEMNYRVDAPIEDLHAAHARQ